MHTSRIGHADVVTFSLVLLFLHSFIKNNLCTWIPADLLLISPYNIADSFPHVNDAILFIHSNSPLAQLSKLCLKLTSLNSWHWTFQINSIFLQQTIKIWLASRWNCSSLKLATRAKQAIENYTIVILIAPARHERYLWASKCSPWKDSHDIYCLKCKCLDLWS